MDLALTKQGLMWVSSAAGKVIAEHRRCELRRDQEAQLTAHFYVLAAMRERDAEVALKREEIARRHRHARRLRAAWYGRRSLFHNRPLWRPQ